MAIRVFLVDDHEVVRGGIRRLLEAQGGFEVVGEAATASGAASAIANTAADIAVLDVRLPDGDGVTLCREIRSEHPEIACLMLTSFADDEALAQAVLAGAAGFVIKQIRGNDLVSAIRAVANGHSLIGAETARRVAEQLRRSEAEDKTKALLSPREKEILALIALGRTNREIANEIYLAEKTVKNYVSSLLSKLGMSHRSQAAAYGALQAEREEHSP